MLDLLLSATLLAQSVGPGFVGYPTLPYYICLNDPRTTVNLRSGPSTRASVYTRLNHGTSVNILGRGEGTHDGMWWAKIRTASGQVGFVRDDYVCVR